MSRWKLPDGMKQGILPWRPARKIGGAQAKQPARWPTHKQQLIIQRDKSV